MAENEEAKPEVDLAEKYGLRPLTRREFKGLRKDGISLAKMDKMDPDEVDDLIDRVIEMVMGDQISKLDNEPYSTSHDVFQRIVGLTYGSKEAEKNSSRPGGKSKKARQQKKTKMKQK
jgi:hypothetical protein